MRRNVDGDLSGKHINAALATAMTERFRHARNLDSEGAEEKKITKLDTVCVGSFFLPLIKPT